MAPVFFTHAHLAVPQLNAGLQVQQVGAQSGHGGAAAALYHIVQTVQYKAGFHLFGVFVQGRHHIVQILHGTAQLQSLQNQQALAAAQVPGVNHPHIGEILGGDKGVLVAGREAGAQVDVNVALAAVRVFPEQLLINRNASGGGGAQTAAVGYVPENIRWGNGHIVQVFPVLLHHNQGHQIDIVLFQQLPGQVAGAVGSDFDVHWAGPFHIGYKTGK